MQSILDLCNKTTFVVGGLIFLYMAYVILFSKKGREESIEMNEIRKKYGKVWAIYIVLLLIAAFATNSMMLTSALSLVHEHGAVQFQSTYDALRAGKITSGEYARKINEISEHGLRMMIVFTALNLIGVTAFYLALRTTAKYGLALEKYAKGIGETNNSGRYAA